MEPITRSEMLMDGQYVEPITRKEKILAGDDLEPVTREEYFLKKYRHSGGDVDVVQLTATENKVYTAPEGKAYSPVSVNVPEKKLIGLYADENKTYRPSTGYDGFSEVTVDVPTSPPSLQSLTASHNGYFVPSSGYDGFSEVTVDVATPLETLNATENGTYTPSSGYEGFSEVTVDVPLPNNAYLLESQKDDVVTIQNGAEFDMPKLIASIEPQQDLHGYDSPWVGGAGKNKAQPVITTNTTLGGIAFNPIKDNDGNVLGLSVGNGTVNADINQHIAEFYCSESGTYKIIGAKLNGSLSVNKRILLWDNTSRTTTINIIDNNEVSVSLTAEHEYSFAVNIRSSVTVDASELRFMICKDSESSTFAPYSNICPIIGWDECKVTVADDLENPTVSNVYTIDLDGTRYGGKLDVVNGVLTLTDGFISSYNGETLPSTWISDRDVYAEGTTPTTGAEVCYKLATPVTYQLTPTEVKSLLGVNNIWADTGEVDVQIWTKEA